jgi:hypothetical protein
MFFFMEYVKYYLQFFCARHAIICLLIPCVHNPTKVRDYAYLLFVVFDCFICIYLTIWGSMILFRDDVI